MTKTNFTKKLQNEEGDTILKLLTVKPRSRAQALGGGPGDRAPGSSKV